MVLVEALFFASEFFAETFNMNILRLTKYLLLKINIHFTVWFESCSDSL